MNLRTFVAFGLLSVSLFAQERVDLRRFVSADAQIVARIQGPGCWRDTFGPTKLGALMRSQLLAPWRQMVAGLFEEGLQSAYTTALGPELMRHLCEDYRGEFVLSVLVTPPAEAEEVEPPEPPDEDAEMGEDEEDFEFDEAEPRVTVMLTMTPAEGIDLAALLAGLRRADEAELAKMADAARMTDIVVGDRTFHMVGARDPGDGGFHLTQVELVDGHLVMFLGHDIATNGSKLLADSNHAAELPPAAPLSVRVDATKLLETVGADFEALMELADEPGQRTGMRLVADALTCLQSFDLTVGADGNAVVVDTVLKTRGKDLGLLAPFLAAGSPSKLLGCVSPQHPSFALYSFDAKAMLGWLDLALELEGEELAEQVAEAGRLFLERNKVRWREDLFAHLGSEVLVLGGVEQFIADMFEAVKEGEQPEPFELFGGSCIALSLRDGRAFGESLEKVIRANGLHAARRTEPYHDVPIHQLTLAGLLQIEYAVTDDALWLVPGRGSGRDKLRAALDARAENKDHAEVATAFAALPEGWNGVRRFQLADYVHLLAEMAEVAPKAEKRKESEEIGRAILKGLSGELKRLGATEILFGDYTSPRGWRTVYRW